MDRYKGSFVGLAVGDALGAPIEFLERGKCHVDDFVDAPMRSLPAGAWTDDTAMALCLAEGSIKDASPIEVAKIYLRWLHQGHNSSTGVAIGVGGTILKALMNFNVSGQLKPPSEDMDSGNGCIMKLAPQVIRLHSKNVSRDILLSEVEAQCRVTHGSHIAVATTQLMSELLWHTYDTQGTNFPWSQLSQLQTDPRYQIPELQHIFRLDFMRKTSTGLSPRIVGGYQTMEYELQSGGYCVDTLEASLWAVFNSTSFEEAVLKAVNLADDADTTGAVTGQLAGALYGYQGIPQKWRDGVVKHDEIVQLTTELVK